MRVSRPRTRTVTTDHTSDTSVALGGADRVVFKHPGIALLGIGLFAVCLATVAGPWMLGQEIVDHGSQAGGGTHLRWVGWVILILPLALTFWVLRVRTVVDGDGIRSVRILGATSIAWADIDGLRIAKNGAVYAVRTDRSEVRLPAVTVGQLSRLAFASGGRIPDPSADAVALDRVDADRVESAQ
ncbi:PH domain-containing protein [Tsukamurella soli]